MIEVLAAIFAVLRVVILGTLTTVIYAIDLSTRRAPLEKCSPSAGVVCTFQGLGASSLERDSKKGSTRL